MSIKDIAEKIVGGFKNIVNGAVKIDQEKGQPQFKSGMLKAYKGLTDRSNHEIQPPKEGETTRIEKLTPEQEAKLDDYRAKWKEIGLSTEPIDFEKCCAAAARCYELAGEKVAPKFYYAASPKQACIYIGMLDDGLDPAVDEPEQKHIDNYRQHLNDAIFGHHDASWLCFYDFFDRECQVECCRELRGLVDMGEVSGWWFPYQEACIICDRHDFVQQDDQHRLHNEDGPACHWKNDDWGIYAVHGVRVPKEIIEDKDSISVESIEAEQNAEVRRVMIEFFTYERYLEEGEFKLLDNDPEWGELYTRDLNGDPEPLVLVKVVNSTAEPDGTFKNYTLRVPPQMKTAREAIAWTFGVEGSEYAPLQET